MWLWLFSGVLAASLIWVSVQWWIRKRIVENALEEDLPPLPGRIKPVRGLLELAAPGLYSWNGGYAQWKENLRVRIFIARQFWFGASNPAIVVHSNPTIIAAYAFDCDAVLLVRFWPIVVEDAKKRGIGLHIGARLLSVNTYFLPGQEWKNDDIEPGPGDTGVFSSFRPYIAEFCSNDFETIEANKGRIPAALWERTRVLAQKKLAESNLDEVRWGNPKEVEVPRSYRARLSGRTRLESNHNWIGSGLALALCPRGRYNFPLASRGCPLVDKSLADTAGVLERSTPFARSSVQEAAKGFLLTKIGAFSLERTARGIGCETQI